MRVIEEPELYQCAISIAGVSDLQTLINVNIKHSKNMHKALKKAGKATEFITYKDVQHNIDRDEYRIDMLEKIGGFLQKNTRDKKLRSVR